MGGELSKEQIAQKESTKIRKELLKGFRTPSARKLGISPFNILILGEVGSGKSSAINTFITAMHDDQDLYTPALALTLPDDNVTPFFQRYSLNPESDIFFFDTWGIYMGRNYSDDSLRQMLEGKLPQGSRGEVFPDKDLIGDRDERVSGSSVTGSNPEDVRKKREIHMVVFCASVDKPWARSDHTQPSDFDVLLKMASLMKQIHEEKRICSAVLMTCTDKLSTAESKVLSCGSPQEIRHLPEVEKRLDQMSKATGVPKMDIFPMLANVDEMRRSPIIDCNALFVVKSLMKKAEGYLEQKLADSM